MKLIAVLGANGQLGQTIKSLVVTEKDTYKFYSKEEVDITNFESLNHKFSKYDFDFCINCAAYTNVPGAEEDRQKAYFVNCQV